MNTILVFLKSKKFLVGVAVVAVLAVIEFGYPIYRDWKFDRELQQLTDEINKPYLEDIYGGKTPKETLEMFIAAVESGDYDLASKYFVLSKQEEWKNKLTNGKQNNNLGWFLDELGVIGKTMVYKDPTQELGGSHNYYVGNKMIMTFIKYPQGIWKIKEI